MMNQLIEYSAEIQLPLSLRKIKLKGIVEDGFTDSGARFFVNRNGEYMEFWKIKSLKFSKERAEAIQRTNRLMGEKNSNKGK